MFPGHGVAFDDFVALLVDFDGIELAVLENPRCRIDKVRMDVERDSSEKTAFGIVDVVNILSAVLSALPGLDEKTSVIVEKKASERRMT